jgi:hypothetical protein
MKLPFAVLALSMMLLPAGVGARPVVAEQAGDKPKMTLCAYFTNAGARKTSYCSQKPLAEAQKECDARLKAQKMEGTCDCTDDQSFINGRCG